MLCNNLLWIFSKCVIFSKWVATMLIYKSYFVVQSMFLVAFNFPVVYGFSSKDWVRSSFALYNTFILSSYCCKRKCKFMSSFVLFLWRMYLKKIIVICEESMKQEIKWISLEFFIDVLAYDHGIWTCISFVLMHYKHCVFLIYHWHC